MTDCGTYQKGFTLIELLVAMTIFAIGLLAIAGMQITAIQYNASANTRSVANAVAQRVMEEILSQAGTDPFFGTAATAADWDLDDSTAATTLNIDGAGTYSATYTVTPDTPVTNLSRIIVNVAGPDNRTATLTSFKRAI